MRKILAYSHLALWAKREIGRLFSNFGLAMRKEDEYIPIQGYPEVNLNEFHRGIKITKGLLSEIQNFQRKLGQNLLYF